MLLFDLGVETPRSNISVPTSSEKNISVPTSSLKCLSECRLHDHRADINFYYDNIVTALRQASNHCVPQMPRRCQKAFWCDELNRLKENSIDMHKLWRTYGSPTTGVINSARLLAKNDYKHAIKQAAVEFEQSKADKINGRFAEHGMKSFRKCWNS